MRVTGRVSRLALCVTAVAAVAAGSALVVPGTLGLFNTRTTNAGNAMSTGSLTMTNGAGGGAAILTASTLRPGSVVCAEVAAKNAGSLPGQFELGQSHLTGSTGTGTLGRGLTLVITQDPSTYSQATCAVTGGSTVSSSAFDSVTTPAITLTGNATGGTGNQAGDWLAGEQHTFAFVVTFASAGATMPPAGATPGPTAADNAYQGQTVSAEFDWYSAQSRASVVGNT